MRKVDGGDISLRAWRIGQALLKTASKPLENKYQCPRTQSYYCKATAKSYCLDPDRALPNGQAESRQR